MGTVDEIGYATLYLASSAASYITGKLTMLPPIKFESKAETDVGLP
jgi:NAD(P)-dependent dehydrogenase (short-subunit alcohol dehydrogenase family)